MRWSHWAKLLYTYGTVCKRGQLKGTRWFQKEITEELGHGKQTHVMYEAYMIYIWPHSNAPVESDLQNVK